jgi:hypothetical protein
MKGKPWLGASKVLRLNGAKSSPRLTREHGLKTLKKLFELEIHYLLKD